MILRLKYISLLSSIIFAFSCQHQNKKNKFPMKVELTTLEPNFGVEDTVTIDGKLEIPNYYYNTKTGALHPDMYKNNKNNKAIFNGNTLNISVFTIGMSTFNFRINKNMTYSFTFNYPECGAEPIRTVIGRRLLLNKKEIQIGDTIQGKFYLKVLSKYPYDSNKIDKIYFFDSCMFKYKIESENSN